MLYRVCRLLLIGLVLIGAFAANGQVQTKKGRRRLPAANKPECVEGSICFSGEVRNREEFRKALNADLEFVVRLPGGIDVVSRHAETCHDRQRLSLWIANPPLRAHHPTEIDALYDWTAEDEVRDSLREFTIVENCQQFNNLYDSVYHNAEYDAAIQYPGHGRLWITDSKVSHAGDTPDNSHGTIEWMKFSVEIKLP